MNKPQNQATKSVTLDHVVSRASKDKVFLNSLIKAPTTTLKNNALKLSAADGKKLNILITNTRSAKSEAGADLNKHFKQLGLKPVQHCYCSDDWAP